MDRIGPDSMLGLIHAQKHLNLHAPRRTGRTSAPETLWGRLNGSAEGD